MSLTPPIHQTDNLGDSCINDFSKSDENFDKDIVTVLKDFVEHIKNRPAISWDAPVVLVMPVGQWDEYLELMNEFNFTNQPD